MRRRISQSFALCVLLAALLSAPIASGAVITVAHYRLGEDDAGASAGAPGNASTVDSTSGLDLTRTGSPTYSANTPGPGSALAMDFGGAGKYYQRTGAVIPGTDNWGVEAWVYPFSDRPGDGNAGGGPSDNFASVAYNGQEGAGDGSGFGIVTMEGEWQLLFGQIAFHDVDADVVANQWVHLAAVRDNGAGALYVNGTQVGPTTGTTPNPPDNFTHVGGENITGTIRSFDGLIDETRFFTFNAGEFDPTTDLFLNVVPEPSSLTLLICAALGFLVRRRR